MGGARSRNKGARGEREVLGMLQPIVDRVCDACGKVRLEIRRNYAQRYAPKQYDLIGIPWLAVEVKRVENLSGLGSWWRQTLAATKDLQTPVLFYRKNHGKWKVKTRVPVRAGNKGEGAPHVWATVTMDIDSWLVWFEQRLKHELS